MFPEIAFAISNVDFVLPTGTLVCISYVESETGVYVKSPLDFRILH